MSGDVSVEMNPAFYYSSVEGCIESCRRFRRMAEEGFMEVATDSHRSPTFLSGIHERWRMKPLSAPQISDAARGRDECSEFFRTFEDYFSSLKESVLEARRRPGDATVLQIVDELRGMDSPALMLKKAMRFERLPSRMDVLAAVVPGESGAESRFGEGQAVFSFRG